MLLQGWEFLYLAEILEEMGGFLQGLETSLMSAILLFWASVSWREEVS